MSSQPPFPRRLFELLSRESSDVVSWDADGVRFRIKDAEAFEHILPKYFRHSKFTSFQRQLNMYGFVYLRNDGGAGTYVYTHTHFQRGREDLLDSVKRVVKGAQQVLQGDPHAHTHTHSAVQPPGIVMSGSPHQHTHVSEHSPQAQAQAQAQAHAHAQQQQQQQQQQAQLMSQGPFFGVPSNPYLPAQGMSTAPFMPGFSMVSPPLGHTQMQQQHQQPATAGTVGEASDIESMRRENELLKAQLNQQVMEMEKTQKVQDELVLAMRKMMIVMPAGAFTHPQMLATMQQSGATTSQPPPPLQQEPPPQTQQPPLPMHAVAPEAAVQPSQEQQQHQQLRPKIDRRIDTSQLAGGGVPLSPMMLSPNTIPGVSSHPSTGTNGNFSDLPVVGTPTDAFMAALRESCELWVDTEGNMFGYDAAMLDPMSPRESKEEHQHMQQMQQTQALVPSEGATSTSTAGAKPSAEEATNKDPSSEWISPIEDQIRIITEDALFYEDGERLSTLGDSVSSAADFLRESLMSVDGLHELDSSEAAESAAQQQSSNGGGGGGSGRANVRRRSSNGEQTESLYAVHAHLEGGSGGGDPTAMAAMRAHTHVNKRARRRFSPRGDSMGLDDAPKPSARGSGSSMASNSNVEMAFEPDGADEPMGPRSARASSDHPDPTPVAATTTPARAPNRSRRPVSWPRMRHPNGRHAIAEHPDEDNESEDELDPETAIPDAELAPVVLPKMYAYVDRTIDMEKFRSMAEQILEHTDHVSALALALAVLAKSSHSADRDATTPPPRRHTSWTYATTQSRRRSLPQSTTSATASSSGVGTTANSTTARGVVTFQDEASVRPPSGDVSMEDPMSSSGPQTHERERFYSSPAQPTPMATLGTEHSSDHMPHHRFPATSLPGSPASDTASSSSAASWRRNNDHHPRLPRMRKRAVVHEVVHDVLSRLLRLTMHQARTRGGVGGGGGGGTANADVDMSRGDRGGPVGGPGGNGNPRSARSYTSSI